MSGLNKPVWLFSALLFNNACVIAKSRIIPANKNQTVASGYLVSRFISRAIAKRHRALPGNGKSAVSYVGEIRPVGWHHCWRYWRFQDLICCYTQGILSHNCLHIFRPSTMLWPAIIIQLWIVIGIGNPRWKVAENFQRLSTLAIHLNVHERRDDSKTAVKVRARSSGY